MGRGCGRPARTDYPPQARGGFALRTRRRQGVDALAIRDQTVAALEPSDCALLAACGDGLLREVEAQCARVHRTGTRVAKGGPRDGQLFRLPKGLQSDQGVRHGNEARARVGFGAKEDERRRRRVHKGSLVAAATVGACEPRGVDGRAAAPWAVEGAHTEGAPR